MSKDKLKKAADELLRKDGFFKKRDSRPKVNGKRRRPSKKQKKG